MRLAFGGPSGTVCDGRQYYLALSSNPKYKHEMLRNVTMMQLKMDVTNTPFQTPGMTVQGLEWILFILGNEVVGDFRKMLADMCISDMMALDGDAMIEVNDMPVIDKSVASAPSVVINVLSRASSSASVAESVEFTETNPEARCGLGLRIDANDKEAPGDAVMNDAADESQIEEISTERNFAVFMAQVFFLISFYFQDHPRQVVEDALE